MASSRRTNFKIKSGPGGLMGQARKYDLIARGVFPGQGESGVLSPGVGGGLTGPNYSACEIDFDEGTVETWDCYTVSDFNLDVLNAHLGWVDAWVVKDDTQVQTLEDDMESYSAQDPITSELNGGIGWDAAYLIVNRT